MVFSPDSDDGYAEINLAGCEVVSLYGSSYSTFFVAPTAMSPSVVATRSTRPLWNTTSTCPESQVCSSI